MESEDNATFTAFDSGISEYESAKSFIVESTSSCCNGEEETDFFAEVKTNEVINEPPTAAAAADDEEVIDMAEKEDNSISAAEKQPVAVEEVDLFSNANDNTSEECALQQPTTTTTQTDDPFDAFNGISTTPLQEVSKLDTIQQSSDDVLPASQQQEDTTTTTTNDEIFFEITNNSQPTTIESTNNNNNIKNINNMQLNNLLTDDELFSNFNNEVFVDDTTKLSATEEEEKEDENNEKDDVAKEDEKKENTITIFDHVTGKECEIPVSSLNNSNLEDNTVDDDKDTDKIIPEDALPLSDTGESDNNNDKSLTDLKAGGEESSTSTNGEDEVNDNTYNEDISTAIFDSMAAQMAIDMNGFTSTVADFNNGESATCDVDQEKNESLNDNNVDNNNICSVCPTNLNPIDENGEVNNVENVEAELQPTCEPAEHKGPVGIEEPNKLELLDPVVDEPQQENLENTSLPMINDTILSEDFGEFTMPKGEELDQNGIEEAMNGDVFGGFSSPPERIGPVMSEPISDMSSTRQDAFEGGPGNQHSEEEPIVHEPSTPDEGGDCYKTPASGEVDNVDNSVPLNGSLREDDPKHTTPNTLDKNIQATTSDMDSSDDILGQNNSSDDKVVAFSSVSFNAEDDEIKDVPNPDIETDQLKVSFTSEKAIDASVSFEIQALESEQVTPELDQVVAFSSVSFVAEQPEEIKEESGAVTDQIEKMSIQDEATADAHDAGITKQEEVSTSQLGEQTKEQQIPEEIDGYGDFTVPKSFVEEVKQPTQPAPDVFSSAVDDNFGKVTTETPALEVDAEFPPQPSDVVSSVENDDTGYIEQEEVSSSQHDEQIKEQQTSEEDDCFGNFEVVSTPALEVMKEDTSDMRPSNQDDAPDISFGSFNAFEDAPPEAPQSDDVENNEQPQLDVPVSTEEGQDKPIDEFGDFNGTFQDTQIESSPPEIVSKEENKLEEQAIDESSPAEDEFAFGEFNATTSEDVPVESFPEQSPTVEGTEDGVAAVASQPMEDLMPPDDDDGFGDWGDADFEEALTDTLPTENSDQQQTEAAEVDDEFGDWGEFDAFEEEAPAVDEASPQEADTPIEIPQTSTTPVERTKTPEVVSVLNESVRSMFQTVFVISDIDSPENKGTYSTLPFDVPMSKILPEETPQKEDDTSRLHPSDQELAKMKDYFANQPRSAPLAILSDDNWYPYSQYEFNKDGSPYADSVERVTAPIVPDVMEIDLPTGFDISESTKQKADPPPPDSSGFRSTPTVVDFPSTPPPGAKKSVDIQQETATDDNDYIDLTELSAKGRQFLEELPDLTYMLKSTLCLPDSEK